MNTSGKSQGKMILNVLQNVDVAQIIFIFYPKIRVINVTFHYTADKFVSWKNILSQRKVMENENLKRMAIQV